MVPTVWLAKLNPAEDKLTAGMAPLPHRKTLVGELMALLMIQILPVRLPLAVGAKMALKVAFWPVVKVSGSGSPLMLKAAPFTETCEMDMLVVA